MKEESIPPIKAFQYVDCRRKCSVCRVGASNSKSKPTFIYDDYKKNIPNSLLNNLDYTLNNSNNVRNRPNKKIKIGYSTSEDAVSWIFINYFIQNKRLDILKEIINCKSNIVEIIMWGVPQIDRLYDSPLKDICIKLGENEESFSEPDIIVICDEEIDFIEVKVKAKNDRENPKKKDFDKYLNHDFFIDKELAKKSEYYELIRNWTIAHLFSKDKTVKLINLAPMKLFETEKDLYYQSFLSSIRIKETFIQLSWEDVISAMEYNSIDSEFVNEIKKRIG